MGKLTGKVLLTRALRKISERRLLRDEQFGFRRKHSPALQLAGFVGRVNRNTDERLLTAAVYLDMREAFDS
jgi:hypothetical protein